VELMETLMLPIPTMLKSMEIASIIGSGINGNSKSNFTRSIGSTASLLLLEVELMETRLKGLRCIEAT